MNNPAGMVTNFVLFLIFHLLTSFQAIFLQKTDCTKLIVSNVFQVKTNYLKSHRVTMLVDICQAQLHFRKVKLNLLSLFTVLFFPWNMFSHFWSKTLDCHLPSLTLMYFHVNMFFFLLSITINYIYRNWPLLFLSLSLFSRHFMINNTFLFHFLVNM